MAYDIKYFTKIFTYTCLMCNEIQILYNCTLCYNICSIFSLESINYLMSTINTHQDTLEKYVRLKLEDQTTLARMKKITLLLLIHCFLNGSVLLWTVMVLIERQLQEKYYNTDSQQYPSRTLAVELWVCKGQEMLCFIVLAPAILVVSWVMFSWDFTVISQGCNIMNTIACKLII